MHEKHGPDPNTHPRDDPELWERSVGGWKKGRLFGFGTTQDPTFALTGESASRNIGRSYVTGPLPEVCCSLTKCHYFIVNRLLLIMYVKCLIYVGT